MGQWKQFTRLLCLFLRVQLGLSVLRDKRRGDPKALLKIVLIGLGIALGVLSVMFTYGVLLYLVMRPALDMGLGAVMLGLVFLVCMVMALVLGTISMISTVFGARDTELYAALPLAPRAVFLAKLGVVYLLELLTSLFLALPAVILYALHTPVTVWYWLGCLIVIPALPAIPMALSALLATLLLRLSARVRRRELFMVVGGFALVALLLVAQTQFSSFFASSVQDMQSTLTTHETLLRGVTSAFPPAQWAAGSLALSGLSALGSLVLYLLTAFAGVFALTLLGGRAFYRGALAQLETARTAGRGARRTAVQARTVLASLYIREWRVLTRTGVYALNALAGIIIFPLMVTVLPMTSGSGGQAEFDLSALAFLLPAPWPVMIAAALMCLPALINPAASTALSREGKQFWLCRALPIPMRTQVAAKLLCAWTIAVAGILMMTAGMLLFLSFPIAVLLTALPVALAASAGMTLVSMLPDVIKPKLAWNNENEAIKQNINSLFGMLLALLPLLLGGALMALAARWLSAPALSLLLTTFFLLLDYGCWRLLGFLADQHLELRDA